MKIKSLILALFFFPGFCTSGYTQNDLLKLVDDWIYNEYNYNYALNLLNSYIEANPQSSEAYLKRALVYRKLGMHVEEDRDLELAYSRNPLIRLQIDKAFLSKIISKPTYDFDWLANREKQLTFDKPIFDAFQYETYVYSLEDQIAIDSILLISMDYIHEGRFAEADRFLNQLTGTQNPIYHDLKGLIQLHKGNLQSAIVYFDRCIQFMPSFALAYHHRGIAYKLLGNFDKSYHDLSTAIEINSEYAVFYFSKALLLERLEQKEEASQFYVKALELANEYPEALINYTRTLKELGQYDEYLRQLDKAIAVNPNDTENYFLKAGLYLIYGEYDQAINEYNTYLTFLPDDPLANYNKGLSLILKGDLDEGCRLFYTYEEHVMSGDKYSIRQLCDKIY